MIPGSALILRAHPEQIRNHDVHHSYRQDTNLFYLTGFDEPGTVLLYRPGLTPESVLFVRVKDQERETWDGFRYGPEGALKNFGVDAAYPIEEFEKLTSEWLVAVDKIYYNLFTDEMFDRKIAKTLLGTAALRRRSGRGILPIYDSYPLIGELRVIKSPYEIATLKKAAQVSAEAHVEVMKATRPGVNERHLHGIFLKEIMARGAAREGYGSIVAGGSNSTTLHYVFNDQDLKGGDLLLVDAGAEVDYYTGDITRTFPVSGRFNPIQAKVYQMLLDLQKSIIQSVKIGVVFSKLQELTIHGLIELMREINLLKGSSEALRMDQKWRKYYPHGVSHFLGSDVHDAGRSEVDGESRRLEVGMVLTIEPGIYIPQDDLSAPEELRGLGLRIEDDILVTESGPENLSQGAPKEIVDLEKIVGKP
ncbi:MAG: aminopeptidase P family protein [Bdellovibrionales bacterium]|nr:aminopeptidase P family protein [Bdellovibrionales bacterium]